MKRTNMKNLLENSKEIKKENLYKGYIALVYFAVYSLVATMFFRNFLYFCIFLLSSLTVLVFVPIDIKHSKSSYFNVHRDAAFLYLLFIVEWDNVIYFSGLDGFPNRTICFLALILSQVSGIFLTFIEQKYEISINDQLNFKKSRYFPLISLLFFMEVISFLPIFFIEVTSATMLLFFGSGLISISIIYSIVRVLLQAHAYRELNKYLY